MRNFDILGMPFETAGEWFVEFSHVLDVHPSLLKSVVEKRSEVTKATLTADDGDPLYNYLTETSIALVALWCAQEGYDFTSLKGYMLDDLLAHARFAIVRNL